MSDLPTIVGPAGLQPQSPAALRAALLAIVTAVRPGYTGNLPASLIEDILSTDVYALAEIDQARVEVVNSLSPLAANAFLLAQFGQMLGIAQGQGTNTSVYVVFTGPPGFVIPRGFTVSDGTFQYVVQDGGIIGAGGTSDLLFCLANQPGSWAVPTNTVTQIVTSYSSTIALSVVNPEPGLPGAGVETETSFRTRVLQANLAESQGMAGYMKTLLSNVPNVQPRLVSAIQQTGGGWTVVCGGGDPFQVVYAIYASLFDISLLQQSLLRVTGITNASPGVVTTDLNHGYSPGQAVNIVGVVGMTGINNTSLIVGSIISPTQFQLTVSTLASGSYASGGIVSPNLRNVQVAINDFPDTYVVYFVNPPQQSVSVIATWNTNQLNFGSAAAVAALANPALVDYVNGVPVGQPINVYAMQQAFIEAVSSVIAASLITSLNFIVVVDGVTVVPGVGSGIISGDPQGYFQTTSAQITVNQG